MAGRDTQEKLLVTAERLFAEYGFDGVTFKQITTEAGQRNASALQYHFGTKQKLVRAIVVRRFAEIDDRRMRMLDEIEAEGREGDLRAVVEAMVYPLAEQLDGGTDATANYYIRFLAQVLSTPRSSVGGFVPHEQNTAVIRAGIMAAGLIAHLPPEIIRQRLASMRGFVVNALADYERGLLGEPAERPPAPLFVSNLVDSIVGMLSAPMSAATAAELGDEAPDNDAAKRRSS